ncbi:two component, sigma54 specific, transcriptional regulator, Fis family [Methylovorus glucosotrophus SIP3-4]|uniref:Two component, sigma54 specific, transcriptional regulator, Fis family n=2 Tax=Methylovorus glucosotrophus TaxID=266009 RepID=C6X6J4_METGS|nr:two component, sigma54 specific, transcriptional regulator, Fis family [Methylovorus glucosotrophus SIP3-4]
MQATIMEESAAHHANVKPRMRILLVEDEAVFARAVAKRLQKAGYECEHAESIADGRALARQFAPDLALLDMRLPDGNGLELLSDLVAKGVAVIVLTAHGDVMDAVNAMKQGATDYIKKPVDLEELLLAIEKAENATNLKRQLDYSRQRNSHETENIEMLGESAPIQAIRTQVERIAQLVSVEAAPPTILISGETGTGKDVVARLLHQSCKNSDRPFVHVDCASLPSELIENELFGHEKGAFTSAQNARCGLIEAAEDGTLFLDEIGELPLTLQAKLLNVLERRVVRRIGSTKERPVLARFIAATNRDLQQMVIDGRFRSDLFYRLNVLSLNMPPLRDRGSDVLLLAQHFATHTERRYGLEKRVFSPEVTEMLMRYRWPGNVRELRHQISRAVLLSKTAQIRLQDVALPVELVANVKLTTTATEDVAAATRMTLDAAEKLMIEKTLEQTHFNISEAARQLGITRMAMRYRMEKHGIRA